MLPTCQDLGINYPVYIRKMNSKSHWNPEGCSSEAERAEIVAAKVFKDGVNSLWLITSDSDFYGIIAALSEKRPSKYQDIDFFVITEEELYEVNIILNPSSEGSCLAVQSKHFNINIDPVEAKKLCHNLIAKDREPTRCKKRHTTLIIEHQKELGCKAVNYDSQQCACEEN